MQYREVIVWIDMLTFPICFLVESTIFFVEKDSNVQFCYWYSDSQFSYYIVLVYYYIILYCNYQ